MFCHITVISTAALLCTSSLVFVSFVKPETNDKAQYEKIVESRTAVKPPKTGKNPPTHQVRTGVQKDFWTQNHGSHVRLKSVSSDLWIQQCKNKFEITEDLESLECCIQDGVSETGQEIKWLSAKQGSCTYPSFSFEAKEANLSIFSLQGTEFPNHLPQLPPNSSMAADFVHWIWSDALHLTGNVRLFSTQAQAKKTFALADALIFHPSNGTLELQADAPKKVLLWQDDVQLSSPSIEIQRDPKKKTEQIKGIGDVHFYFTGEEEAMFYKIFGIKT
jgi:hypothetical protein